MNAKSTLALVLLASAAGAWYFMGDEWGPQIGIQTEQPEPAPSESVAVVNSLSPDALTVIQIDYPTGEPLKLSRATANGSWSLSGNWPIRQPEVSELVDILGNLRTRYHAEPLSDNAKLSSFGLDPSQKPLTVKVKVNGNDHTFVFGEPSQSEGESAFTQPAYVRVSNANEVLKLGPDVMPILRRPAEAYRRRQLFPDTVEVRIADAGAAPITPGLPPEDTRMITLPGPDIETITILDAPVKLFSFRLSEPPPPVTFHRTGDLPEPGILNEDSLPAIKPERIADAWELTSPWTENPDPEQLQQVLAAIAGLWVERFVPANEQSKEQSDPFGFVASGQRLRVTLRDRPDDVIEIEFGSDAGDDERYARLKGDTLVFTVSTANLGDLFRTPDTFVDDRIARFGADEVTELVINSPGREPIHLTRVHKGDLQATKPRDRDDRWVMGTGDNRVPADRDTIERLLRELSDLTADEQEREVFPTPPPEVHTTVSITARETRARGEPLGEPREYTLQFGTGELHERHRMIPLVWGFALPDVEVDYRLPVWFAGRTRGALVDDLVGLPDTNETVFKLLTRSALAYRSKQVIDAESADLESVALGDKFKLEKHDGEWKLAVPFVAPADAALAGKIADAFGDLQATEYITDSPTAEQLAEFGLDKPQQTVTLGFGKEESYTLKIGKPRPDKPEVFAQLNGLVFGLNQDTTDLFPSDVLALLPGGSLLSVDFNQLSSITVNPGKPGEAFTLTKDAAGKWGSPGAAFAIDPFEVQVLSFSVARPQIERLVATGPDIDWASYGLASPTAPTITLTTSGLNPETHKITLGNPDPTGARYARFDDLNAVALLSASSVEPLTRPLFAYADGALMQFDPTTLVGFTRVKDKDTLELLPGVGLGWDIVRPIMASADQRLVESLAEQLGRLRASRVVDVGKKAELLPKYGLEPPAAVVTVTAGTDVVEKSLRIGKPVDAKKPEGERYAVVESGNEAVVIGVIPGDLAQKLLAPPITFRDRTVFKVDATRVDGVQFVGEAKFAFAKSDDKWEDPNEPDAMIDARAVQQLVSTVATLRADRYTAAAVTDFKPFGLAKPFATVTLTRGSDKVAVLELGGVVPDTDDKQRYARVADSKDVFVLTATDTATLTRDRAAYLPKK